MFPEYNRKTTRTIISWKSIFYFMHLFRNIYTYVNFFEINTLTAPIISSFTCIIFFFFFFCHGVLGLCFLYYTNSKKTHSCVQEIMPTVEIQIPFYSESNDWISVSLFFVPILSCLLFLSLSNVTCIALWSTAHLCVRLGTICMRMTMDSSHEFSITA